MKIGMIDYANVFVMEVSTFKCQIDKNRYNSCPGLDNKDCKYWKKCKKSRELSKKKIMNKVENQGKWM